MAAIITSTSTQFTLDQQNWWPEHDTSSHGDKHGHHRDIMGSHGNDSYSDKSKHKYGKNKQHEVNFINFFRYILLNF